MNLYYHRKLYALLYQLGLFPGGQGCEAVHCLQPDAQELQDWWQNQGIMIENVAKASDRVTLEGLTSNSPVSQVSHLISGERQNVGGEPGLPSDLIKRLNEVAGSNARKAFWWLWRFYPEFLLTRQTDALLFPADRLIPDCPKHSYYSTVSAIAGTIPPDRQETDPDKHPYLLLFTFSPVQEFIKSSRKFLDFWAGSYLLHYLSARLCWFIARIYGPDAVITPSLWSQEIIDALLIKQYPEFKADFLVGSDPVTRFKDKTSTSLSTAGFPNVITAIVPGKLAAEKLGNDLSKYLKILWRRIACRVRNEIRSSTIAYLTDPNSQPAIEALIKKLAENEGLSSDSQPNPNQQDLERWKNQSCWEWKHLCNAQIHHSWEPYWTAVPLGNPVNPLEIYSPVLTNFNSDWIEAQEGVAPSRHDQPTPMPVENELYESLNIGTWWGNVQSRLAQGIQAFKNTRVWQISPAPGERSTLSGQLSALHPSLKYQINQNRQSQVSDYREGAGVPSGSMQLFWELMSLVYPGLFNGSEKLNALELTKRMAWVYGGVAQSLGIDLQMNQQGSRQNFDYESFIRFPNLSSIAAARFAQTNPQRIQEYWDTLGRLIQADTLTFTDDDFNKFAAKTRRPFQIQNADLQLQTLPRSGNGYNGVMFSSKWLADDMGLKEPRTGSSAKLIALRQAVSQAHHECNFGDSSPADWWAIVAADGDNMGKYVSGRKLELYNQYIDREAIGNHPAGFDQLLQTRKRMGPATHIGLNRALLDFSNRIVPYLTEKRFCGKVVYSGGDDVLAVLPLADVLSFLRSLRAAWSGAEDPGGDFDSRGGYWHPRQPIHPGLPNRPLFTMGQTATLSAGIVIAHKSVPLPTVLESLWSAEEDRAKKMAGASEISPKIPVKDGLCFRVIYGSGNVLEASMKGQFLEQPWWDLICSATATNELSPVLYRLAEQLPIHSCLTPHSQLISKAAKVIVNSRDKQLEHDQLQALENWLNAWEEWAYAVETQWQQKIQSKPETPKPIGCTMQDLASLLRFSAFWLDKTAH